MVENGLHCWNSELAFGIPTYNSHSRINQRTCIPFHSIIDHFLSTDGLLNPTLVVHEDLALESDYRPLTLCCLVPPAPSTPDHSRLLWHLSRLQEQDCPFGEKISTKVAPFKILLLDYIAEDGKYTDTAPNIDDLATTFNDMIHLCLDNSVGRRSPRPCHHSWFWTSDLQDAFDHREACRRAWKCAPDLDKVSK
ncbi:hypothetical protein CU097_015506 [Rhizopus azygosporus]|uniref:Endonuclease/exonuclease/phosphatase domain-containing protein n=1 Tax=Rhizopus azygosporus TaxID=86630 RepID=A0A367KCC4_RHIAZ|nr:hypothetical protein CU097_015506 [Rhizopus azygosporus]